MALFFFILGIIFGKLFLYNRKDNIEESKLEIGIIMKDLQDKKGERNLGKTNVRRWLGTMLVFLMVFSGVMSIHAAVGMRAEGAQDGLTAILTTDRDSYDAGDTVAAELTVVNENSYAVGNVRTEISLPDGLTLQSGSLTVEGTELAAGMEKVHSFTALLTGGDDTPTKPDETKSDDNKNGTSGTDDKKDGGSGSRNSGNSSTVKTGDDSSIGLWIALFVISGSGLVILVTKKKDRQRLLSLILALSLTLTMLPSKAQAASVDAKERNFSVDLAVTLNGKQEKIRAQIWYDYQKEDPQPVEETVTIRFETGEGTPVEPITLKKGEASGELPQSYLAGYSFRGWYRDEALTQEFFTDESVQENLTLYPKFVVSQNDLENGTRDTYYSEDCDPMMPVVFVAEEGLSKDDLLGRISWEALTGELPEDFTFFADGENYTLTPVGGYEEGCLYRVTIPEGMSFADLDEEVLEYTFRIHKDDSEIVELSDSIKYVNRDDMLEGGTDNTFAMTAEQAEKYAFAVGDVLCMGDGESYDTDSIFLKISDLLEQDETVYVTASDAEIEDVFKDVDVSFTQDLPADTLIGEIDTQAIEDAIRNGEGFAQMTDMLAALLTESKTVQGELQAAGSPAFTENASIKEETMKSISASLAKGATVTVSVGEANNPNFGANADDFIALCIEMNYEATIKNKVKIKASFGITEYLAVSMQGYSEYKFKLFGKSKLEFDYAMNLYTQTDIDMQVLVCSTNKANEEYTDISKEIKDMLSSDEENDTGNLVKQMQDMVENDSGEITLLQAPLLQYTIPVIPILPVFGVNLGLDFVIKVNFAAGIGSDISILEATQIGMCGNTSDGSLDCYTNDLIGGNRYDLQFYACGFLDIKAGLEGSLTLSFYGLSRFGEIGISVFIGAYVDIYGYVQLGITKAQQYSKQIDVRLVGGYYMESGIALDIELIARSKFFKVKVGAKLLEAKFPLFTLGDQYVLLAVNEVEEPAVLTTSDSSARFTSASLAEIPALTGTYLNLKNGDEEERSVPWDKLYLTFSNRNFDYNGREVSYDRYYNDDKNSDMGTMYYYYMGPYLQFTKSASTSEGSTVAQTNIIWADTTKVDESAVGKICEVELYANIDGKTDEYIGTRKVLAGNKVGPVRTEYDNYDLYTNQKWDQNPYTTVITEDTRLTLSVDRIQMLTAFIYYLPDTKKWMAEVRAVNVDEAPTVPAISEDPNYRFDKWTGTYGQYVRRWAKGPATVNSTISGEFLRSTGMLGTHYIVTRKDTTVPLLQVTGDTYEKALAELTFHEEFNSLVSYYSAEYIPQECTVTLVGKNLKGEEVRNDYTVLYGETVHSYYWHEPIGMNLIGFSDTPDGEILATDPWNLPATTESAVTYYMVYASDPCEVEFFYYDPATKNNVSAYTKTLNGGTTIPADELANVHALLQPEENVEYRLMDWMYRYKKIGGWMRMDVNNYVLYSDIQVAPVYERNVKITLDAGEGTLVGEDTVVASSQYNYRVFLSNTAWKEKDEYCTYQLTGWKDETTGKIYPFGYVTISEPVALTAVYEPTDRVYKLDIITAQGTLKNGDGSIRFTGGYDDYQKLLAEYSNWRPADVRGEGCTMTLVRTDVKYSDEGYINRIYYSGWNTIMDQHTLTLDAAGGVLDGESSYTYDYGTRIFLDLFSASKEDVSCTYVLSGWKDSDGNTYAADDELTLKSDLTLTAIWTPGVYKEYKLTYVLDGKTIAEETHHFGDVLTEAGQPEEAEGKIFSGWTWYRGEVVQSEMPETMPAEDLTAIATAKPAYVRYIVGDEEISSEETAVGSSVTVKEKYEKTGYTIGEWTNKDVTVTNGTFTMPAADVTFRAEAKVNSYTVSYYVDGTLYYSAQADYGSYVMLQTPPEAEGKLFVWNSEDVTINGSGFTMPAGDVRINGYWSEQELYIIYYLNGEIAGYDKALYGETVRLRNVDELALYDGRSFSGWYTSQVDLANDIFTMPSETLKIYGDTYDDSDALLVCTYTRDDGTQDEFTISAAVGETVSPVAPERKDYDFAGWRCNGDLVTEVTPDGTETFIELTAEYTAKKYTVSYYIGLLYGSYPDQKAEAGEKVYVPELPKPNYDWQSVYGWYSTAALDFQEDEGGKYFIMPAYDVRLEAVGDMTETDGYSVKLILSTPYHEAFEYRTVKTLKNGSVYLPTPRLSGCTFDGWQDADGNYYDAVSGWDLDADLTLYGTLRKTKGLHIAEFWLDGEVYAYRLFDEETFILRTPDVSPEEGKTASGWQSFDIELRGDDSGDDLPDQDLRFDAFTCDEAGENAIPVELILTKRNGSDQEFLQFRLTFKEGSILQIPKRFEDLYLSLSAVQFWEKENEDGTSQTDYFDLKLATQSLSDWIMQVTIPEVAALVAPEGYRKFEGIGIEAFMGLPQ